MFMLYGVKLMDTGGMTRRVWIGQGIAGAGDFTTTDINEAHKECDRMSNQHPGCLYQVEEYK